MDNILERYLRTGDSADLPKSDGGYALPDDWFNSQPIPTGTKTQQVYAMPALTPAQLEDAGLDLRAHLIEQTKLAWAAQDGNLTKMTVGPARCLRDPYSAKPYVLFYVSASAFEAPTNSPPRAAPTDGLPSADLLAKALSVAIIGDELSASEHKSIAERTLAFLRGHYSGASANGA